MSFSLGDFVSYLPDVVGPIVRLGGENVYIKREEEEGSPYNGRVMRCPLFMVRHSTDYRINRYREYNPEVKEIMGGGE